MNHPRVLASSARHLSGVLVDAVRRQTKPLARLLRPGGEPSDDEQLGLPLADDGEPAARPEPQHFVRPDEIAVAALLGRAFDDNRRALGELLDSAVTTVIEVPGAEFVEVAARIMRRHVAGPDSLILDGDGLQLSETSIVTPGSLVVFARDGNEKSKLATKGNAEFACAVQRRFAVVGIAADPERTLPRDLVRMADHRIVVPPLDADAIATVIGAITGRRPRVVDPELGRRVTLGDLLVAVRADLGRARSLKRLKRLVAGDESAVVPTLTEMHGLGEAREWGLNLVDDLQAYMRKTIPWAAVDKGCLLSGPPGTGKTTFAKSLARSAGPGVHFIATSYSQWQSYKEGHLGNVTSAIRASFAEASQRRPCILFVDEIDTIPARGSTTRHDDWWTAIVAALLECMDGVERREGVVVIGAGNQPGRIDPALTRPGRLDKHIRIPLPDTPALAGIFRVHLGNDLDGVDLNTAAVAARGCTGADVERWVRTARRAARVAQRPLTLDDLIAAIRDGVPDLPADVRRRVAYHEAGHAVAAIALDMAKPISLSINPSGGLTETVPTELSAQTREYLEKYLVCRLAGRAAEELVFGAVTAGAGGSERSDLSVATQFAIRMETSFGLGAFGPVWAGDEPDQRDLLLFADLRRAVRQTMDTAYTVAKELLSRNRAALDRLADALFARGYLEGAEIDAAMAPPPPLLPAAHRPAPPPASNRLPPAEPEGAPAVDDAPTTAPDGASCE